MFKNSEAKRGTLRATNTHEILMPLLGGRWRGNAFYGTNLLFPITKVSLVKLKQNWILGLVIFSLIFNAQLNKRMTIHFFHYSLSMVANICTPPNSFVLKFNSTRAKFLRRVFFMLLSIQILYKIQGKTLHLIFKFICPVAVPPRWHATLVFFCRKFIFQLFMSSLPFPTLCIIFSTNWFPYIQCCHLNKSKK